MHSEYDNADEYSGHRFLIATAIAHHQYAPEWDRPGLVEARNEIIDLFTKKLGYQHISDLGLDPNKTQLTSQLRRFCREARPDDLLAVYIAGHGEILDDGEHVLLTNDTDPDDIEDALLTAELARKMLSGTNIRRVLLMLDTCYAGRGGNDLTQAALTRMTEHWQGSPNTGLVVLTSAQPAEQAQVGAFPQLLRAAIENLATAGYAPKVLPLDAVITAMNSDDDKPPFQTITSTLAQLTGRVPPFLLNTRHNPQMTEVDLAIQQASQWDADSERRDIEFRTQLLVRAMGGHDTSQGWWFAGRQAALLDITSWLHHIDPAQPMLAVTADPGSGKTAVLGLIATLTHSERRATVPLHTLGLPSAAIPAPNAVDVVIYAQKLTTDQVFQGITAAAQVRAGTVGEFIARLGDRPSPLTVLIDALDEAADPDQLCRKLLAPLAEHAQGRLRLLVGTRPHLLAALALRREDNIDLDAPRYADIDALTNYAARGLLEASIDSPYPGQEPEVIRAVARAVAQASDPSFLVARITSAALAADPAIPDPNSQDWRRALPRLPAQAMRRDLETRLGENASKVRDLLRPLAFAEGQGLPWEDLWAPLASSIAGLTYTDDDLLWLRSHAGSYVIEAVEAGRSAYRLYHQALAEHLRDGSNEGAIHRAFTQVLRSRVPVRIDGTRDWTRAHPYILRHLATHAARCGQLDELISDVNYLVFAYPNELLPALHSATTEKGRLTCAIYRASAAIHSHLPPSRRRHALATDAARFAAAQQQHALAEPLQWPPRWATGQQISPALHTTLTGHENPVNAIACADLNEIPVCITSSDNELTRVWDLATGGLQATLTGHEDSVTAVTSISVAGTPTAVTGSSDRTVRMWDLATGRLRATLTGHEDLVTAVACANVGGVPVAVSGSYDRTVRIWDLTTGTHRATLTGHDYPVYAVACANVGGVPVAVSGSYDRTVRIWDLTTGTHRATLTGHDYPVNAVACANVGGVPVAVSGSSDQTVRIWDLTTGTHRATLTGHENSVNAVACANVGGVPVAVSGSSDRTVRIWDLATGSLRAILTGHEQSVNAVACSSLDQTPITITGSGDQTVRIWHLPIGVGHRVTAAGHTSDVTAAACTFIGAHAVIVSGSDDQTVRIWDLTTGSLRATLIGHENLVTTVACGSLSGAPIAVSGSYDRTVRIWDLATGSLRAILTGHEDVVTAVACTSLNGEPVAVTGSSDRTVRIWDLA
ncbi:caspase family protein, partial [Amycolatopsis sp. NPDC051045]|uniref:caspase family protein n=1 Tax=Amycolatopsis sp. NPDC051045 TaxID=3156922 RepID=UPI0034272011